MRGKNRRLAKLGCFQEGQSQQQSQGAGGGHALSWDVNIPHEMHREQSVGHPDQNIYGALETEAQIRLGFGI